MSNRPSIDVQRRRKADRPTECAVAHGGEIRLESIVGKGSVFEVTLPLIS